MWERQLLVSAPGEADGGFVLQAIALIDIDTAAKQLTDATH